MADTLANAAANPSTDPAALQELASNHPELQESIANNPAAYPDLLTWISQWGTEEAKKAAKRRLAAPSAPLDPAADETQLQMPPAAPQQPTVRLTPTAQPRPLPTKPPMPTSSHASPVPVLTHDEEPEPESEGTKIWLWVLLGVAVGGLVLFLVWFFLIDSAPEDERAEEGTAAVMEDERPEETDEDSSDQEDLELEPSTEQAGDSPADPPVDYSLEPVAPTIGYPAPPTAVSASWFISPSENISCEMGSTTTACTIYEYDFSLASEGCGSGPATIEVSLEGVEWHCDRVPIKTGHQSPILEYSTSSAAGYDACLSTVGGMSCWNTLNGNSFAVSKHGWVTGTDGLIPESSFPWIDSVKRR